MSLDRELVERCERIIEERPVPFGLWAVVCGGVSLAEYRQARERGDERLFFPLGEVPRDVRGER